MLKRLTPQAELVLIILICFGPFVSQSVVAMAEQKTVIVFNDSQALFIIGVELVAGAFAVLLLRARGWTLADLGLRPSTPQTLGGLLLLIGTVIAIGSFEALVNAATGTDPGSATEAKNQLTWPVLIALTLINPLYDEMLGVAYIVRASEGSGVAFAITLSATVRFLCSLEQGPFAAVAVLPLGILFALVYWRWRLVWPLVVAHGVMDFLGLMPRSG